jgi:hypothetical protein
VADVAHCISIEERVASLNYFQTMKIPLLQGRFFTENDKLGPLTPILINQTLQQL